MRIIHLCTNVRYESFDIVTLFVSNSFFETRLLMRGGLLVAVGGCWCLSMATWCCGDLAAREVSSIIGGTVDAQSP